MRTYFKQFASSCLNNRCSPGTYLTPLVVTSGILPMNSLFTEHKHRIYLLARDVANLSPSDPFFPVARHKDMYTGFSWASGIVPGTRQEESASEVRLL